MNPGSRFVGAPLTPTNNANGVSTIQKTGAVGKALTVSDNPAIRDFIVPDETTCWYRWVKQRRSAGG
jgi:hypothetical protein